MEHLPEPAEVSPRRQRALKVGAILASAVLALGMGKESESHSGEWTVYEPTEPAITRIDSELKLSTFNLHGEGSDQALLEDIEQAANKKDWDAIALQEVKASNVDSIIDRFDSLYFTYVMSDARAYRSDGGLGNGILTRQPPRDIDTVVLEGASTAETTGAFIRAMYYDASRLDIATLPAINRALSHWNRSALALTIDVRTKDGLQPVNLLTSHPSPHDIVRYDQIEELGEFMEEKGEEVPTFAFADFNTLDYEMDLLTGEDFTYQHTEPTLVGSNFTLDYVLYNAAISNECPETRVNPNLATDHRLVEFSIDLGSTQG